MLSGKKKVQIASAFVTLLLCALAVGCKGFFVNPTLTTVTVGPTATINQGGTVQMSAVGTYNDGSTQSLNNVFWSSDPNSVASITAAGLVTGVSVGSATITGASGTVSGTATVMVALSNVTGITVTPTTENAIKDGGTATFTAKAIISGGSPVPITSTATWTITAVSTSSGTTDDFQVTQGADPAVVTVQSSATIGEKATLTASYVGGTGTTFTAIATITVTP